jgi:UDP-N-acetylglucosamine 4,6-dehydratase
MTLRNGNILLTGGSGSFGYAFVRRALELGARRVAVFSRDELKQAQMRAAFGDDPRLRFFVGDVRDRDRLDWAVRGCDTVIHAAAMKRIETCEADPAEAVATNITGTVNVAQAAIHADVRHAIFLSTDKAPVPHTLYGMTKAVAERLWIQSNVFAAGTKTRLSATRYGNVLGSRGSVLDTWRRQVSAGDPLTVTSEAATRFWMTIEDAVNLVLLAGNEMRGGEIFVPMIGSAPILDLARAVAMPCGDVYAPGHVVTGLRPGERLHETLISEDEARHTIERAGHYVIRPESVTWGDPPLPGVLVPEGFTYRSDTNPRRLTVDTLRRMIG